MLLNTLKHTWNHPKIPFKHLCYTPKTMIKHLWDTLKLQLNFPWDILETSSKHPWNTLESYLKRKCSTLATPLKHPWNTHKTPLKHQWNTLNSLDTLSKYPCCSAWDQSRTLNLAYTPPPTPRMSWKIQSFKNEYFHPLNPHHYGSDESRKNFSVLPCLFHPDLAINFCKGAYKWRIIQSDLCKFLEDSLKFCKFRIHWWIFERKTVLTTPIMP